MKETCPDGYVSKEIKYTKKGLINRLLNYDETGRKIKEEEGKCKEAETITSSTGSKP